MDAPVLPDGITARPARLDDAAAILALLEARAIEVIGASDVDAEEIDTWLTDPDRELASFSTVLVDAAGALVGWVGVEQPDGGDRAIVVHEIASGLAGGPAHEWLLRRGAELARDLEEAAGTRRPAGFGAMAACAATRSVLERIGLVETRRFVRMHRPLDGPLEPSRPPDGVLLADADVSRDGAAIHACLAEAFADHIGGGYPALPAFLREVTSMAGYDPSLWTVAWADGQVVGATVVRGTFSELAGYGYVSDLGVRRAWRGRGLGRALLLDAFARLRAAGLTGAALHVDADSLTGANRLYARAGMQMVERYAHWSRPDDPARG